MISKPSNWDSIDENAGEFKNIVPGGYVCIIRNVTDNTEKQRLELEFDICDGDLKGYAVDRLERFGNWPYDCKMFKYYTEKAMPFFKGFVTALEQTNRGFTFDWKNPKCVIDKGIGVIFGEEEYLSTKDNEIKIRIRPQSVTTAGKVRSGDFKMPALKKYKGEVHQLQPLPESTYTPFTSSDDELPF